MFGPSLKALSGSGCVSMNNPFAPAAIAALAGVDHPQIDGPPEELARKHSLGGGWETKATRPRPRFEISLNRLVPHGAPAAPRMGHLSEGEAARSSGRV